jgi:prolyl oligopeptidase
MKTQPMRQPWQYTAPLRGLLPFLLAGLLATPTSGWKTCRANAPWPGCASATPVRSAAAGAPGFEARRSAIREVLDSRDRFPSVTRRGDWLYNLWQDASNPRGLWRRTTLAEYRKAQPAWETVLDLDALGRPRRKLGLGRRQCLGPDYRRCLLSLSRGGADAKVVREFDTVDKRFVDGGFTCPKPRRRHLDRRRHAVRRHRLRPRLAHRFGLPACHQALAAWPAAGRCHDGVRRRTPDVSAYAWVDHTPGFERTGFGRSPASTIRTVVLLQGGKLRCRWTSPATRR